MKKILFFIPISVFLFLCVIYSCNNSDDYIAQYHFGYLKILNNTNNIYQIQIDSSYLYYCNEVRPKRSIFCDLPEGWHNVQIDTVYNNQVYITTGEVTVISVSK